MRCLLRSILITAAALVAIGACATKPPPPEPTPPLPSPNASPPAEGESSGHRATIADGSAGGSGGSGVPPAKVQIAQTAEENRVALDKLLNDSLGSFDARLRKEQQRIAQERDARQATVAASTASATAVSTASDGTAKSGTDQNADVAGSTTTEVPEKPAGSHGGGTGKGGNVQSAHAGDLKSDKSSDAANGGVNGNGALANEIPDGNDDDIVARRLRMAAEQETDPELKDKLWKEYVEYKKNVQVK
jgi:hypothetical protein